MQNPEKDIYRLCQHLSIKWLSQLLHKTRKIQINVVRYVLYKLYSISILELQAIKTK